jgi:CBS domain-containing protein
VSADTTIAAAVEKLGTMDIGCLLVVEDDQLVGIFTERDVLNRVAERYGRIKHRPISDVMTQSPNFAYDSDPAGAALTVMAAKGFRHVPVIDSSGRIVGIIGPQRVANFVMSHIET